MKNHRFGFLLIISSLIVITVVVALSIVRQKESKLEQIRVQGIGVTRSLSMLPLDLLAPKTQSTGVLHSLLVFYKHSDFAYGLITATDGKVLGEVTSPGIIAPQTPIPSATASLFGERTLELAYSGKPVREFYGPVMKDGNVAAFIRIGYFEPHTMLAGKDLSFFALLALPTFLLVPLIYLLIKREMKPLSGVQERLESMLAEKSATQFIQNPELNISSFAEKISQYVEQSHTRMAELEYDKINLLTTNRLLEYNSNKLNFVLHCFPDGVLILDPAGNINFASVKIKPLFGIEGDAMLNQPVESWCNDEELKNLLLRYRTPGTHSLRPEIIEFTPKHAPEKWIRASAHPLVPPQEGMVFGTLIVLRDITIERLGQQSSHDFVAQVSHELKSPLNVISMYCETLQNHAAGDEALRIEATNVIHDETERMAALVNNLLNISKMETGGLQPHCSRVKVEELLEDIFYNLQSRAEASGVTMAMDVPKGLAAMQVDKDMLRIAINNLLTNAIKYTDAGGRVMLQIVESDTDTVITVRDTGIGIPVEDQPHVFDKFFRAGGSDTRTRSGHGLGLYLANEIVRLHHGRIALESEPGKGSAFSIHIKKSLLLTQEMNVL